jgi:uncharacterized protein YcfL
VAPFIESVELMNKILVLMLPLLLLIACSDDENKVNEHVWKEQTKMLDKAKGVEALLRDSALEQQQRIEDQVNQ